MRSYRGCKTGSDHFLLQTKLRIPPRWIKKKANVRCEPEQKFKVKLFCDDSISGSQWVCREIC